MIVREGDRLRISKAGDTEAHTDYRGAIFIRYDGPEAESSGWIQFIWIEVQIESDTGSIRRATGKTPPTTSNDEIELTTDPADPKVYVDSGSAESPCYEDSEIATAEANGGRNGIWDRPDGNGPLDLAHGQIDSSTRALTAIMHFTDYLVVDGAIVYTVSWEARARWDLQVHSSASQVPVIIEFKSGGPGGKTTSHERGALDREYPGQDVLP